MAQPFLLPMRSLKGQGEADEFPPPALKSRAVPDEDYPLLHPRHRASHPKRDDLAVRKERAGFFLLEEGRPDRSGPDEDISPKVTCRSEEERVDADIRIDNWMDSLTSQEEGNPGETCKKEVGLETAPAEETAELPQEGFASFPDEEPPSDEASTISPVREKSVLDAREESDDLDAHLRDRRRSPVLDPSGGYWNAPSARHQRPLESLQRIVYVYSIIPVLIVFYALISMTTSNTLIQSSYPMATWAAFAIWGVVSQWNVLFHLRASMVWQIFVLLGFAGTSAMGHSTPLEPFGLSEAIFLSIVSLALVATIALDIILTPRGYDRFRAYIR